MFGEEFVVQITEIAEAVRRSVGEVEQEAQRLGVYIGEDWRAVER